MVADFDEAVMMRIVATLLEVMPAAEAERWIHSRQRRLDGCRQCDLILAGGGGRVLAVAESVRNRARCRQVSADAQLVPVAGAGRR